MQRPQNFWILRLEIGLNAEEKPGGQERLASTKLWSSPKSTNQNAFLATIFLFERTIEFQAYAHLAHSCTKEEGPNWTKRQ